MKHKFTPVVLFVLFATAATAQNVGVGTNAPGSKLTVSGSLGVGYNNITATSTAYTPGASDYYILYNGTFGTMTLPAAVSGAGNFMGRIYVIRNNYTAALTIAASTTLSEKIDGAASISLQPGYTVELISTGATTSGSTTWNVKNITQSGTSTNDWLQASTTTPAATANNQYVSGNVGIANTNPQAALDVVGTEYIRDNATIASVGSGMKIAPSGGVNYFESAGSGMSGSADLYFTNMNNANQWMAIKANGNVGINNTSPAAKLDINGSEMINGGLSNTSTRPAVGSGTLANGEIRGYSAGGTAADDGFLRISAGAGTTAGTKSYIDLSGYSNGVTDMFQNIAFGTSGTERMRILSSGNVGIGTASPSALFSVGSTSQFQVSSTGAITSSTLNAGGFVYANTSGTLSIGSGSNLPSGSGSYIQNTTSQQATSNFNISGAGVIGTTLAVTGNTTLSGGTVSLNNGTSNILSFNTNGVNIPAFTTSSTGTKVLLYPSESGTTVDYAIGIAASTLWHAVPQNTSSFQHTFYGGTTELMRIRGDGNVGINNTSPAAPLDVHTTATAGTGALIAEFGSTASSGRLQFYDETSTLGGRLYFGSGNPAEIQSGGNLAIMPSNYLGIGTTSPSARLYALSVDNSNTTNIATFMANNQTYGTSIWYGGIRPTGTNSSNLLYLDGQGGGAVALQTQQTGNVGIATGSPYTTLDVQGHIINSAHTSTNEHATSEQGTWYMGHQAGSWGSDGFCGMALNVKSGTNGCGNSGDVAFYTWECNTSTQREIMRINGRGNVMSESAHLRLPRASL